MKSICITFLLATLLYQASAQQASVVKTYPIEEAKQAVAADSLFFYVINNQSVSKYEKSSGQLVSSWNEDEGIIRHLNSGNIIGGKLYCAHSNYPDSPMAGSIEIFDPKTMEHTGNHSFGIDIGSATWIDFYNDCWWVGFAHYTGRGSSEGKTNSWTQVVRFDRQWRRTGAWIFPPEVIAKFGDRSNSGGFWGKDGLLYCTGHDARELYVFSLPDKGFTLKLEKIIPVESEGQGIAWDKSVRDKFIIYGIRRSASQVVVMEIR